MNITNGPAKPPKREVDLLLGLGIFFMPYFFAWLLLRRGYGTVTRVISFSWLACFLPLFVAILFPNNPNAFGPFLLAYVLANLVLICALVWGVVAFFRSETQKRAIVRKQEQEFLAAHQGWDLYISPYNKGVIGLNRDGGQIVLGSVAAAKTYPLLDVASVEILKDGASITTTNRGSQVVGAAVGDLLLGPAGMLLGGLSGKRTTRQTIHSVAMKVIVDDRAAPVHVVEFFKSPARDGTDAKSPLIRPSLAKADHFHALMVNALRRVSGPTTGLSTEQALPSASIVDQLSKLWELRLAGALTEEEFTSQKAQLIGSGLARIP